MGIACCGNWRAIVLTAYSREALSTLYASSVTWSSFKLYLFSNYVTKNKHFLSTQLLSLLTHGFE